MLHKNNEKFDQLQLQLQKIQSLPPPEKYSDQQQRHSEKQHLELSIANYEAFLELAIGQQVTDGSKLGTIVSLVESAGGRPEAWVSWGGDVAVPEQPCRLKAEPLLRASLKVGDTIPIESENQTDDIEQGVGCGVQGVGSEFGQEVEQVFSPDSCSTTPHTLHPTPAPTGHIKIASFLGDGWILATDDHRYHADSLIFSPECQHRWTICWTPGSRLVLMCQDCLAKEEVVEGSILEDYLDRIENLKQELVDKAALRPKEAKQLESKIKDKDKQLYWLKAKLASLPIEPEQNSSKIESLEVEVVATKSPASPLESISHKAIVPVEQPEESHELSTTITNADKKTAVTLVETEELSSEEEQERRHLEQQIERAFYIAGVALKKLRDSKLYRSTHKTFELYCRERFGFTRYAAYLKIAGSQVYQNLEKYFADNCRQNEEQIILPTKENQVRYIAKAELELDQQVEAWKCAVEQAGGKRPPGRLVQDVVQQIKERKPMPNPYSVGDVCLLTSKGDPELRKLNNCWCIILECLEFSCIVRTWTGQVQVKVENLKSLEYSADDREKMRQLCARLNRIDVGALEETALVLLDRIGKLQIWIDRVAPWGAGFPTSKYPVRLVGKGV